MMTLDEAIEHCHEKAKDLRTEADYLDAPYGMDTSERTDCLECAKEHEQLAEWLTELKQRREKDKKGEWITAPIMPQHDNLKDKLFDEAVEELSRKDKEKE